MNKEYVNRAAMGLVLEEEVKILRERVKELESRMDAMKKRMSNQAEAIKQLQAAAEE